MAIHDKINIFNQRKKKNEINLQLENRENRTKAIPVGNKDVS